jgi:cullin 3
VTDTFAFNDAFTSPLARIKIQQIANRVETQEEDRDTRAKVEEERKFIARVRHS